MHSRQGDFRTEQELIDFMNEIAWSGSDAGDFSDDDVDGDPDFFPNNSMNESDQNEGDNGNDIEMLDITGKLQLTFLYCYELPMYICIGDQASG